MDYFDYENGDLYCEDVPVQEIVDDVGTPCYVYSRRTYNEHLEKLQDAFEDLDPLLCYSVKANTNPTILRDLEEAGSGFDVVSGGELSVVLDTGVDPKKIFFSGVGKSKEELKQAINAEILAINVESEQELEAIEQLSSSNSSDYKPGICIRVNPDVDPDTHRYITTGKKENKFGVDPRTAKQMARKAISSDHLNFRGLHSHIGSQITQVEPYKEAVSRNIDLINELQEIDESVRLLNMGGGFGIYYKDRKAKPAKAFADGVTPLLEDEDINFTIEPGRFIVGNAGILLTEVLYKKPSANRTFVICDAGMNHMIRPALYDAYHRIWPAHTESSVNGRVPNEEEWDGDMVQSNVVGPICETTDFFSQERDLPPVRQGDLLSLFSAGAYGYVMSSHYNLHPRPTEVLVEGDQYKRISRREKLEDMTNQFLLNDSWTSSSTK